MTTSEPTTLRLSKKAEARLLAAAQEELEASQTGAGDDTLQDQGPQKPTLADRFVGMNQIIVDQRVRTRLSEATLAKTLELALNYHVWQTQQEQLQGPQQAMQELPTPTRYEPEPPAQASGGGPMGITGLVLNPDDPRHPRYAEFQAALAPSYGAETTTEG